MIIFVALFISNQPKGMKIETTLLIADLIKRTKDHLHQAETFLQQPIDTLNWKENAEKWSILECFEHLNRYGDFYIPEITKRIQAAPKNTATDVFKSGLLGNYFAESMLPKEKLNKMKTFKSMNPAGSTLDKAVIEKFIQQQKQLLNLLEQAQKVNLSKTKTSISISKLIKLKLGDTFRVVIYHNYRHLVQANGVLKTIEAR